MEEKRELFMWDQVMEMLLMQRVFFYLIGGFTLLGILIKFFLSRTYKRYIKAADEMGTTKLPWMNQLKLRFETLYKLKIGVKNVDVFVEKHGSRKKFLGILLLTWERISNQMPVFCLLFGILGGGLSIWKESGQTEIILYFSCAVAAAGILFLQDRIVSLRVKREMLLTSMQDYFQNYYQVRMEREYMKEMKWDENLRETTIKAASKESDQECAASKQKEDKITKKQKKLELKQKKLELKLANRDKKTAAKHGVKKIATPPKLSRKEKSQARHKEKQELIQLLKESRRREFCVEEPEIRKPIEPETIQEVQEEVAAALQEQKKEQPVRKETETKASEETATAVLEESLFQNVHKSDQNKKAAFHAAWEEAEKQKETSPKTGKENLVRMNKKSKIAEDKLIEDVLREFLA